MKMYSMLGHFTGDTYSAVPLDEAAEQAGPNGYACLVGLAVGSTWTDAEGNSWTRVDDRNEPEEPCASGSNDARRLERIATAALQGLIASGLPINEHPAALRAVVYAKALIAELDEAK